MIIILGEQLIDLAGSKSDVLVTATSGCKKVSLEIQKIKKPEKVFSTYKIPKDEYLIAYCKGLLPLFGLTLDGLIFTDKAFYPFPRDTNPLPSNRIPYTDLCKYIITQESGKGAVFLQSGKTEYEIYSIPSTLISQRTLTVCSRKQRRFMERCRSKISFMPCLRLALKSLVSGCDFVIRFCNRKWEHVLI